MPTYEYRCESCGEVTEAFQRLADAPLEVCPRCGGRLKKMVSAPAFQFKGTGWYVTDYANKSKSGKSSVDPSKESKEKQDSKGGEGAPKEAASGAKPESKPAVESKSQPEPGKDKAS